MIIYSYTLYIITVLSHFTTLFFVYLILFFYICNKFFTKHIVTMVNVEHFAKRLKKIIDYYDLSASSFADKIGVQRSSISHLLSGRNKPSLDFILKVLDTFDEVTWEWLLLEKGAFPKTDEHSSTPDLFSMQNIPEKKNTLIQENSHKISSDTEKNIEQIVIFYKNGTFKNYRP